MVGGVTGLQHHRLLIGVGGLDGGQTLFQSGEAAHDFLALGGGSLVQGEGLYQGFGLSLDVVIGNGVTGEHIVHGDAQGLNLLAHFGAAGTHQNQVCLQLYDALIVEVAGGHGGELHRLGGGNQVFRPGDHAAGGDAYQVCAHFIQRQHRGGGQANDSLGHGIQHQGLGEAQGLHVFGVGHYKLLLFRCLRKGTNGQAQNADNCQQSSKPSAPYTCVFRCFHITSPF